MAIRHMWRMANGLDNADVNEQVRVKSYSQTKLFNSKSFKKKKKVSFTFSKSKQNSCLLKS